MAATTTPHAAAAPFALNLKENAAAAAKLAHRDGLTLKDAVLRCGYLTEEAYDRIVDPEKMV